MGFHLSKKCLAVAAGSTYFDKSVQLVLLTILAEEAVREAKLARALIRISPTVVGE